MVVKQGYGVMTRLLSDQSMKPTFTFLFAIITGICMYVCMYVFIYVCMCVFVKRKYNSIRNIITQNSNTKDISTLLI